MGERSSASFLGFTWVHKLPLRNFEVEHTLGSAFSAEKSAKPNILLYSSNLNLVLPWYPKISLWNIKPFVGLGLGYVFNFGNNFGLKIDEEEFPPEFKLPYILGNNGNFQYNFGGGGKIQVWQQWWLRISLRDYILPSVKRLAIVQERGSFFSTGRDTTHNIALTFSLVHID
ncbi:MAG TPA: hypothetical protein VM123_05080 [archaeon]|nr:hypothetical protein [archaeon]